MFSNNVIQSVKADLQASKSLADKYRSELNTLPVGRMCCRTINNKKRYYHLKPSGQKGVPTVEIYISKEQEELKIALTRRRFLEKSLEILEKNIRAGESYLNQYEVYDPVEVAESMPKGYTHVPYDLSSDMTEEFHKSAWEKESHETNPFYPETLTYKTQKGIKVRSKSEAIIAGQLEANNIPFRYEAILALDGQNYYPDFTILNPQNNTLIYWEHFGLADNPDYNASMERKLNAYKKHNILPWTNLIATYETEAAPLDAHRIHSIIMAFLLP